MRCSAFAFVVLSCIQLSANEWRQFRGPDGQGHAGDVKNLPTTWSESENIVWKGPIPGRGWSSPVFAGPTIWLTSAVEHEMTPEQAKKAREGKLASKEVAKEGSLYESIALYAIGINADTGKTEHQVELFRPTEFDPIHSLNSFASPSPVLDGKYLYCHFGEMGTACINTETASVVWKTVLPCSYSVGPGSSPIVHADVFVVPCDGTDQQYVIALDKLTGKEKWKTKRPPLSGTNGDFHKSFSSPLVIYRGEQAQIIIPGAQWVVAYDPADGGEIWRVRHGDGFSNVPRPVAGHGMVYICTGFMSPQLWAIDFNGQGDVTESHVRFKISKQVPNTPSPVLVDGQLYFVTDQGVATSIDALTGKVIWTKRLAGNYSSSPLYADGKIFVSSHEGKTLVIKPGPAYDEIAANSLDGKLMASPAVLDETLLLRSQSHLYRVGQKLRVSQKLTEK